MISEKDYIRKTNASHRKRFAQFFTPEQISDFMAEWILRNSSANVEVLEPAFGLGVFSRSIYHLRPDAQIKGYEIDRTIFNYAQQNIADSQYDITLQNQDYLTASWNDRYDAIICNPPYLKFHDYDNTTLIPLINQKLHVHLNGFTNLYTLFLLKSINQLKEGGRLAYIIPSEFLNSDYGVEVKRALLESETLRHIIIIDFTQCAFDDALTTACILLCEKSTAPAHIHFSTIDDITNLTSSLVNFTPIQVNLLNPEIKWKQYYENTLSAKYQHLVPFATFAKVSRGIATGANNYFTFKPSKKDLFNIPDHCFNKCICHAADINTQIFTEDDFEKLSHTDKTIYIFNGCADETNPNVKNYIELGIEQKIDKRYLTASRTPWYALEKRKPAPIWVSVFNRDGLRFVRNKAEVYNLTTFHCVYNKGIIDTDVLFTYLITDIAKEIFLDNSRQYGNGLIKFEPNDLNKGNVVDLRLLTEEEKKFLKMAYDKLRFYGSISTQCVRLIDKFFRAKYTHGQVHLEEYVESLRAFATQQTQTSPSPLKDVRIKQLNFLNLFTQYANTPIVENNIVQENLVGTCNYQPTNQPSIDEPKNALIALVKNDSIKPFLDYSANTYYTGRRFPATVALDKLYYFIPYIKGKGIKDLYLIKAARLGTRKEGQADNDPNDIRLVFEIEFLKNLFNDYTPIELKIWRTFTDTTLDSLQAPR